MNEYAGSITFNVNLNTKQLEKKLKDTEKNIEKYEEKRQKLINKRNQMDDNLNDYYEQMDTYRENNMLNDKGEIKNDWISNQIDKKYGSRLTELNEINTKIEETSIKEEKEKEILNQINEALRERKRLESENGENKPKIDLGGDLQRIGNEVKNIGSKIVGVVKSVVKWSMALIGIRTLYGMLSNGASQLQKHNKQVATDLEYIRFMIGSAFAKVIEKIINLAKVLLTYLNYIWYKVFGVKLFGDATAKSFKNANSNAKQLKKTLAGFDEMNVVGSNGDNTIDTPSFNPNDFDVIPDETKDKLDYIAEIIIKIKDKFIELWEKIEPSLSTLWEKFLKPIGDWILEKPERLLNILGLILALNIGAKFIGFLSTLSLAKGGLDMLSTGLNVVLKGAKSLITGGFNLLKSGVTSLGSGVSTLAGKIGMSAGGSAGLIGALVALDAILITKIVKDVKDELIPAIKETSKEIDNAKSLISDVSDKHTELNQKIIEYAESEDASSETIKRNTDYLLENIETNKKCIKQAEEQISVVGALTGENKVHKASIEADTKAINENIATLIVLAENGKLTTEQAQKFVEVCKNEIEELETKNESLRKNSEEYKKNKEKIEQLKNQIDKTKGTYNVNVKTSADKTKVDNLKESIDNVTGTHNVTIDASTKKANKTISNWLSNMGSSIFTTLFPGIGTLTSVIKKFPYAKGGIVNLPGKGVPIGGERGPEGVIPLTDSQQMMLLGKEIGKWITINLTNNTNLDGRAISRHTSRISSNTDFIRNR